MNSLEILSLVSDAFLAMQVKQGGSNAMHLPQTPNELHASAAMLGGIASVIQKYGGDAVPVSQGDQQKAQALCAQFGTLKNNFQRTTAIGTTVEIQGVEKLLFHTNPAEGLGLLEQIRQGIQVASMPKVVLRPVIQEVNKIRTRAVSTNEAFLTEIYDSHDIPLAPEKIIGKSFAEITAQLHDALLLHRDENGASILGSDKKNMRIIRNAKALHIFDLDEHYAATEMLTNPQHQAYLAAIKNWKHDVMRGLIGGDTAVAGFSREVVKEVFSLANMYLLNDPETIAHHHTMQYSLANSILLTAAERDLLISYSILHNARNTLSSSDQQFLSSRKPDIMSGFDSAMEYTLYRELVMDRVIPGLFPQEGELHPKIQSDINYLTNNIFRLSKSNFSHIRAKLVEAFFSKNAKDYQGDIMKMNTHVATLQKELQADPPETIPTGTPDYPRIYSYTFPQESSGAALFGKNARMEFFGANAPDQPKNAVIHFGFTTYHATEPIYGSIDVGSSDVRVWIPGKSQEDFPLLAGYVKAYALSLYADLSRRKTISDAELVAQAKEQQPITQRQNNGEVQLVQDTTAFVPQPAKVKIPTMLEIFYQEGESRPRVQQPVGTVEKFSFRPTTALTQHGRDVLIQRQKYLNLVNAGAKEDELTEAFNAYNDAFEHARVANVERIQSLDLDPDDYYVEVHLLTGEAKPIQTFRSGGERERVTQAPTSGIRRTNVSARNASALHRLELSLTQSH
jgi:hypothetical protein